MRGPASFLLKPAGAYDFLLGAWRVTREVSGMAGMSGTVDVRECGDDVAAYSERMQVRTEGGAAFTGSQRYLVRRTADGFALHFAESGLLFQDVAFASDEGGRLASAAAHHCGEDRYASTYVLGPGREMVVRHVVTGPRKSYVSVARFAGVKG